MPSGLQDSLRTCVVPLASLKGSAIALSFTQSDVRQTISVLSSDWVAKYLPIGSQVTPLTRLVCPRNTFTCSTKGRYYSRAANSYLTVTVT